MSIATPYWWTRRRVEPAADEAMGNEAGMLPFSFEPEETLGDTEPAQLDEPASAALAREARNHRRMYLLVVIVALGLYFGHLA